MSKRTPGLPQRPRGFWPTPRPAVVPLIPYLPSQADYGEPCAGDGVLDGTSNRGSRHGNSILNEADVAAIRGSNLNASDLADKFGVSETTVRDVTTRRTWSHLK